MRVCREIDLSGNALTTLPGEIFKTNAGLTSLSLRDNPLTCVPLTMSARHALESYDGPVCMCSTCTAWIVVSVVTIVTFMGSICWCCRKHSVSGLNWVRIDIAEAHRDTRLKELEDEYVQEALRSKTAFQNGTAFIDVGHVASFTKEEWEALGIHDLPYTASIRAGGSYFRIYHDLTCGTCGAALPQECSDISSHFETQKAFRFFREIFIIIFAMVHHYMIQYIMLLKDLEDV